MSTREYLHRKARREYERDEWDGKSRTLFTKKEWMVYLGAWLLTAALILAVSLI